MIFFHDRPSVVPENESLEFTQRAFQPFGLLGLMMNCGMISNLTDVAHNSPTGRRPA